MTETQQNGSAQVIFQARGISKRYKTRSHSFTLQPVDISLRAGEITSVVGENGDGKTTLLSMISGRLYLSAGMVEYPYLADQGLHTQYQIRQKVIMVTQDLPPWTGKLVDNLHFYAALQGIKGDENEEWVHFILERLGLMKYKDATWKQISGGYRMRFSLARALIQRPHLLVLDEPLANLDINTQLIVLGDLRDLAKSFVHPLSLIISSQHLHEIENISDHIVFIRDGETLYNGLFADFEADRKENTFELVCDASREELEKHLKTLKLSKINTAGENFILTFPIKVDSSDVLKLLLKKKVRIMLFRDISQSTRKLFAME